MQNSSQTEKPSTDFYICFTLSKQVRRISLKLEFLKTAWNNIKVLPTLAKLSQKSKTGHRGMPELNLASVILALKTQIYYQGSFKKHVDIITERGACIILLLSQQNSKLCTGPVQVSERPLSRVFRSNFIIFKSFLYCNMNLK